MKNRFLQFFISTMVVLFFGCSTSSDGNGNSTTTVVPIAPTNLTGIVISTSQVNLSWTDNSTNEVGFKIERKIVGGTYALLIQTGTNVTNFSDQNIQPNTSYSYRVYAYNSSGESLTYTNEITVFTAVVPVITTTNISSITSLSATSGGNITNDNGSTITSRGICWSTSPNPTILLSTKTVDGSGLGNFVSNLMTLNASTTYYVRAYATNSNGTGYGNELTFTTNSIDITSGLVAYYPFNGNANDESGNGNNGVTNGVTNTTDRNGNANSAYNFNGTSDNIKINNTTSLNNPSVSISGWFLTNSNATDTYYGAKSIIAKYWDSPSNCNSNYNSYVFCLAKQNNKSTVCLGTSFYSGNNFYYNQAISVGTWYHFTFVHDSNYGGKIYINGQLVATNTTGGMMCNGINPIYIGADVLSGNLFRFFNGKIDDIRIYNRSLSQNEISYLASH
jgi:hypothetical protein